MCNIKHIKYVKSQQSRHIGQINKVKVMLSQVSTPNQTLAIKHCLKEYLNVGTAEKKYIEIYKKLKGIDCEVKNIKKFPKEMEIFLKIGALWVA